MNDYAFGNKLLELRKGLNLSQSELADQLTLLSTRKPQPDLLVRGDGEQTYEKVLELLKIARQCGFENAMLVTQAEGK